MDIEKLPIGVVFTDKAGIVAYQNAAATRLLGEGRIGTSLGDLPDAITARRQPRPDGGELVLVEVDSTRQLRTERERLLHLAAVGATLPKILHEIRNPLAAMLARVELMIEENSRTELSEDLFSLLGEIRYVIQATKGVGGVGGRLRGERFEAVDFAIEEATRLMVPSAESYGVAVRDEVQAMPLLPFDTGVIRGLVVNLVNNAVHACSRGDEVTVRSHVDAGELVIEVEDTGSGMSDEAQAHCRELFFSSKRNGSGIGLTLVIESVESAAGSVEIQSALGVGTTISIRVPLPKRRKE